MPVQTGDAETTIRQYRSSKASLSASPLALPVTAVQQLVNQFQDYLHFPDPTPIYTTLGCIAANFYEGVPVWLMMIGPPGCGKTMLLESLSTMPRTRGVKEITGTSSLLSGTSTKEKSKDATGGILREVGLKGTLILNEFTSILSMQSEQLVKLLAAFRSIYDGEYSRDVGSDGARRLTWGPGKIAAIAGCTEAIDDAHKVSSEMGERWVYYRFPTSDGYQESLAASKQKQPGLARRNVQELVTAFFESLDLGWGPDGKPLRERRDLTPMEARGIIAIATIAARCRSAVVRDQRSREVERVSQPESPTRLTGVLTQIYIGLEACGLGESDRWAIIRRIALDSMPQNRLRVLERIVDLRSMSRVGDSVNNRVVSTLVIQNRTIAEVQKLIGVSTSTVQRTLQDMELHGIVEKTERDKSIWTITDWVKQQLRLGWRME